MKDTASESQLNITGKTAIGLTFKELMYIISLVVVFGIAYADVKRDIEEIKKDYVELKIQTNDNSKNYQFIKESLIEINGKIDMKADKNWTK